MMKAFKNTSLKSQTSSKFKPWKIEDKDVYQKLNLNKEIALTWVGVVLTLIAFFMSYINVADVVHRAWGSGQWGKIAEQSLFSVLVLFLTYGNLLYQITRIGYFYRLKKFKPADQKAFKPLFRKDSPSLTILIPSYKEERRIILQTLFSAALLEYPRKRVVLLIDDPTYPQNTDDLKSLQETRALPGKIQGKLNLQADRFKEEYLQFTERNQTGPINLFAESLYLCGAYQEAADWFKQFSRTINIEDHTDELFVSKILWENSDRFEQLALRMDKPILDCVGFMSQEEMETEYLRLISIFDVTVTSFERKKYVNLSNEPNKAMNLNSYIGLLGKNFNEVKRGNALFLERTTDENCFLKVPVSDYLITLDADSLLSWDYAICLIEMMERPGHERLAVAQTPYSAIPNAPGLLERVAGATTDMQYNIHQGFTQFNATYWVGANALLRVRALDDIQEEVQERGQKVSIFIQDRTVIEDTESSIDLVYKGWKLFNYPRRMSYSATPPDFGSLLIQRRRWANGGLIILPKLLHYLCKGPKQWKKFGEGFMRFHYLVSIAAVNLGVPILLLYNFKDNLNNIWLPLTSLPYYFFYGRDLIQAGYKLKDLFRVYALNLILIPINLGGVFKSIEQLITKAKIPFHRTPKVMGRTVTPALYLVIEYLILIYLSFACIVDFTSGRYLHAAFSLVNSLIFCYAIAVFIGFKESIEDIFLTLPKKSLPKNKSVITHLELSGNFQK